MLRARNLEILTSRDSHYFTLPNVIIELNNLQDNDENVETFSKILEISIQKGTIIVIQLLYRDICYNSLCHCIMQIKYRTAVLIISFLTISQCGNQRFFFFSVVKNSSIFTLCIIIPTNGFKANSFHLRN